MAAGAAHELSTPLGTIAVAAGELARDAAALTGGDALAADIGLIRAELARARRILTDLSGRADDGAAANVAIEIGDVIDRALAARPAADRARVSVTGQKSLTVWWPAPLVARALDNVIANALQASASGLVLVSITQPIDTRVRIGVVDQGRGMSAETLARAGEPFFTTRSAERGMGLGLYVARAAAEQLGGTLTIESVDGRGTTVTIDLRRRPERI